MPAMTAEAGLVPWAEVGMRQMLRCGSGRCVAMVGADGEEAGVFALGAGVGLEGDGVEAGDFGEPFFEVVEEFGVAGGLVGGGEGMEVAELGPGDGDHLAGGVELHGAGAEGDHGCGRGRGRGLRGGACSGGFRSRSGRG